MKGFAFEVGLIARVRVRAAHEATARQVVPSVLAAPGSFEITLANENNVARWGGKAVVTGVDFIAGAELEGHRSVTPADERQQSRRRFVGL